MTLNQMLDLATLVFKDRDLGDAGAADLFFREYGVGNTLQEPDKAYERFTYYRDLLTRLREADENKFKAIHKGTPLYFLSWLAFDLHQYEAALQYIDAAIEEDKRTSPNTWPGLPGPQLILLNATGGAAERTVAGLATRVAKELDRFSTDHRVQIRLNEFLARFAWSLLTNGGSAIVAGFYAFLLEFDDRLIEVELRSDPQRGSYQPLFVHLFKGGLLLETLLKYAFPHLSALQLGSILQHDDFEAR
ncbi:MAG TPA: hypothetical protein VGR71_08795, partial [Nitrospira sp.]|nr:hypothetical protein [Nitrospira sp.]